MMACCECCLRGAPERIPNQPGKAPWLRDPRHIQRVSRQENTSVKVAREAVLDCNLVFLLLRVLDMAPGVFRLGCGMPDFLSVACGIYFSEQGLNPGPLHWECGVSATGPPGKS